MSCCITGQREKSHLGNSIRNKLSHYTQVRLAAISHLQRFLDPHWALGKESKPIVVENRLSGNHGKLMLVPTMSRCSWQSGVRILGVAQST